MRCDADHKADKAHHHEGQAHELAGNKVEEVFHAAVEKPPWRKSRQRE